LEVQAIEAPQRPPEPGGFGGRLGQDCVCGCASCATFCDGKGPVIGGGRSMRFALPITSTSGHLGAMVRARGVGGIAIVAELQDGSTRVIGDIPVTPGTAFAEAIARRPESVTYDWSEERLRPLALKLVLGEQAQAEIDCVVPWLTR
jgi:hypothetical protein